MIPLGGGDVMEKMHQFLTDQVLDGVEDNGIGEDGSVKRMGSKGR